MMLNVCNNTLSKSLVLAGATRVAGCGQRRVFSPQKKHRGGTRCHETSVASTQSFDGALSLFRLNVV